jgi:hypothetical protein
VRLTFEIEKLPPSAGLVATLAKWTTISNFGSALAPAKVATRASAFRRTLC